MHRGAQRLPGPPAARLRVLSTLSVVMEPLGPDTAVRKVEASRTADLADAKSDFDHLNLKCTLGAQCLRLGPAYLGGGVLCEQSGQRSLPCWLFVHPAATMRSPTTVAKELIVRCSWLSRTKIDGQSGLSQEILNAETDTHA